MPVVALAEQCGLLTPADEHLTVPNDKGANAGRKVASLVGAMLGGADSIADTAVLRHGAMGTIFDRPYVPSTLGSFLREFSFGHVRQLDAVASRMLWPSANACSVSQPALSEAIRKLDVELDVPWITTRQTTKDTAMPTPSSRNSSAHPLPFRRHVPRRRPGNTRRRRHRGTRLPHRHLRGRRGQRRPRASIAQR